MSFDGSARFGPSVIRGRKPSAPDEILFGPRTLSALRLHIGDRVEVYGQAGTWEAPGEETSTRMTVVGTGLTPMTEAIGRGAVVTIEGLRRLSPGATEQAWFVRLDRPSDRDGVVDAFRAAFPAAMRAAVAPFEYETVASPSLNLDQIGSVPMLFAAIMGVMAAAVLTHVLVVAGRARRRDLAILRALGFSRGQTLRTVMCESMVYAVGALAVGLPTGVVSGRLAWRVYAANLGAVPEPVTPWIACAAVAATTLVLAGALAIVPGVRARRARPGDVLRTE
jgi:putative ABC transport system permease protein